MRMISAVFVAAVLVTGTANAQMKKPATPQGTTAVSNNPAVVVTNNNVAAEPTLESAKRIQRDEAIKMVKSKKAVWIDVRPADIYAQGHIAGAINIPLSDLQRRFKDLPVGKYYITYCA
jgi:3-mercaptopyruvate sulfurtransferase SseA